MQDKCNSPGCLRPANYICSCTNPKTYICDSHLSWHINTKKGHDHLTKKLESSPEAVSRECQLCLKRPSRYLCICRGLGVRLCVECFEFHSLENPGRHTKEPVEAAEFIKEEIDILFYTERRDQIDGILKVVKENLKDIQVKEELFRIFNSKIMDRLRKWYEENSLKITQAKKALQKFEEEITKCKYIKDLGTHWIARYLKEKDCAKAFKTVKLNINEDSFEAMLNSLFSITQEPLLTQHTNLPKPEPKTQASGQDQVVPYQKVESTLTDHGNKMLPKLQKLYKRVLDPSQIEKITQIELANCLLGPTGARYLSILLAVLPQLTYLNLCSNAIGPVGAKELASGLPHTKTLNTLLLSWNKLENKGIENLAEALSSLPALKVLQLSWNDISELGAQLLSQALVHCENLEKIDLWNNPLGPEGIRHLVLAFPYLKKLRVLDLNKTELGSEGAEVLAVILPKLAELTTLYLANNHIGDSGIKALGAAIGDNKKLQNIDLARNSIKTQGSVAVRDVMGKMKKEGVLVISGNLLGKEDLKNLRNCASHNQLRLTNC